MESSTSPSASRDVPCESCSLPAGLSLFETLAWGAVLKWKPQDVRARMWSRPSLSHSQPRCARAAAITFFDSSLLYSAYDGCSIWQDAKSWTLNRKPSHDTRMAPARGRTACKVRRPLLLFILLGVVKLAREACSFSRIVKRSRTVAGTPLACALLLFPRA